MHSSKNRRPSVGLASLARIAAHVSLVAVLASPAPTRAQATPAPLVPPSGSGPVVAPATPAGELLLERQRWRRRRAAGRGAVAAGAYLLVGAVGLSVTAVWVANPACWSFDLYGTGASDCEPPPPDTAAVAGFSAAAALAAAGGLTLTLWGSIRIHRARRQLRRIDSLSLAWWRPPSSPGARGLAISCRF